MRAIDHQQEEHNCATKDNTNTKRLRDEIYARRATAGSVARRLGWDCGERGGRVYLDLWCRFLLRVLRAPEMSTQTQVSGCTSKRAMLESIFYVHFKWPQVVFCSALLW